MSDAIRIKRAPKGPELESEVLRDVREWLASQPDVSIHRNNSGALKDATGRLVRYGLAVGSSDLIGSLTVHCRPIPAHSWAGETSPTSRAISRSLAIEVKTATGTLTADQSRFLEEKRRIGWITGVVRSVDEAKRLIERARRWEV